MLPPESARPGAGVQRAPLARAITAKSMSLRGRAARLCARQLRHAFALAAQKGSEAEPVVEPAQRRQVRQPSHEILDPHLQAHIAGDAREAAGGGYTPRGRAP